MLYKTEWHRKTGSWNEAKVSESSENASLFGTIQTNCIVKIRYGFSRLSTKNGSFLHDLPIFRASHFVYTHCLAYIDVDTELKHTTELEGEGQKKIKNKDKKITVKRAAELTEWRVIHWRTCIAHKHTHTHIQAHSFSLSLRRPRLFRSRGNL